MSDLQKLLSLLILKSAPQDIPYSLRLLLRMTLIYFISGLLVLQTTLNPDEPVPGLLLGLIVQCFFVLTVLRLLHKDARFVQTFTAMMGIGVLFNLMSWPVFAGLANDALDASVQSTMSLLFLLMISWEILVKAHILKHALEVKMVSALLLSFSLFFITVALSQLLLPVETAG